MPDVISTAYGLTYLILIITFYGIPTVMPTPSFEKLKLRDARPLPQGHQASNW